MAYFIYELFYEPESGLSFLRLLSYISFRSIFSFVSAFFIAMIFGRRIIDLLFRKGMREHIRDFSDIVSSSKKGTPTMGGLIIILSVCLPVLLWCNLNNRFIQILLFSMIWFGCIGFWDDYLKMKQKSNEKGLSRTKKLLMQGIFGLFLGIIVLFKKTSPFPDDLIFNLYVPFIKNPVLSLSWFYLPFIIFIMLSISNAVNFADGLDGLAIVPASVVIGVYGIFAYVLGNANYSQYLLYDFLPGSGEVVVFCAACIGAGLGFLWFNAYPAQIFMGDTGSQALGGVIGAIAVLLKQEFLFLIIGGLFLAEAVSVLIQDRIGINFLGKRIFGRSPLHHTFQYRGIAEPTVVIRFWIVAFVLGLIGLITLKIR